jgi:tubulin polyglutamylase TTLL1
VAKCSKQAKKGSLIVQQYITRPLLYNGRKFDLRTYMLVTSHNGKTKAYWYQDGYVRTSSAYFSLEDTDPYIHLTNDAVQKHADSYSNFEPGNKLSYSELQRYLDGLPSMGRHLDLSNALIPKMKEIAAMAVGSTWIALNNQHKDKNFELFGLDFMIDEDFKPWLIEINTNACLEMSSPVLERLIPYLIENTLRIGLDTVFPPPDNFGNNFKYNIPENSLHYNKYELIFDSDRDGPSLQALYQSDLFFRSL